MSEEEELARPPIYIRSGLDRGLETPASPWRKRAHSRKLRDNGFCAAWLRAL